MMVRHLPQHWLLFISHANTGLAVQLEHVTGNNGISRAFTPSSGGDKFDIDLDTRAPQTDFYRDLEKSAEEGGQRGYDLMQNEGIVKREASFRFQFEEKYQESDQLRNIRGASADLLFGLAVVTAAVKNLDIPPFAATGRLGEEGQVLPVHGLCAKIDAALSISALHGKGLIFYPMENDDDINADLRYRAEQAQVKLFSVTRLEDAVKRLGIPIKGTWMENPYRHLNVFRGDHHRIYFGRERETHQLIQKLLEREELKSPSLLILGPSGGGKSSLVQAGIIPELKKILPEGSLLSDIWDLRNAVNQKAGTIASLIRASWARLDGLAALSRDYPESRIIETPAELFTTLARDLTRHLPDQVRFVWVLDQLEQFFSLKLSDEEKAAFINFLYDLKAQGIWIVATFRNDFYSALQAHDGLLVIFDKSGHHDIENLSETAIERIIQKPAKLAKVEFEKDDKSSELLSLRIKNDALRGGRNILPLLEFTLYQLYEKRTSLNMTYEAYHAMGELHGAIGNHADDILDKLNEETKRSLGDVLWALTAYRRDSEREQSGASSFIASVANMALFPLNTPARKLVDAFVKARLLVSDRDAMGNAQVRVTHEALLTHWPKAAGILNSNASDLELRDQLIDRALQWKKEKQESSLLLQPGSLLKDAENLLKQRKDKLDKETTQYIEESSRASQDRQQKELKAQRQKTRFVSVTAVVLGIFLLVAIGGVYFANQRGKELAQSLAHSDLKEGVRLVELGQPKEALAYLARAMRLNTSTDSAAEHLASSLILLPKLDMNISNFEIKCHNGKDTVQFSPDGSLVLIACDKTAQVWDIASGKAVSQPMEHKDHINTAAFSYDGKWIITASMDHLAQIWEAETGKPKSHSFQHQFAVTSAEFSPDDRWIRTTSDNTLHVWDVNSGSLVFQKKINWPSFSEFSPNGRLLIMYTWERSAHILDLANQVPISYSIEHDSNIFSIEFSSNGNWIVSTSWNGKVQLWNAATRKTKSTALQDEFKSTILPRISPSENLLLTISENLAQVWDLENLLRTTMPIKHDHTIKVAQFSPDGQWLAAASDDIVKIWEVKTGKPVTKLMQHENVVTEIQFSPDNRWIMTVNDKAFRIWEADTAKPLSPSINIQSSLQTAKFSPNSRWTITVSVDRTLQIWDVARNIYIQQPVPYLKNIRFFEYSIDGRWIVIASNDKSAQVLEVNTGKPLSKPLFHQDIVISAKFSPNGRWLLTVSKDKKAQVWDVATGNPVSQPMAHQDDVRLGQFSSNGKWILTISNKLTRVWDSATGNPVSQPMLHQDIVTSAQFSPSGRWIVTVSGGNKAQIWDSATGNAVQQPLLHQDSIRSVQFSQDDLWVLTCSDDKTAQVWDTVTGKPISKPMKHENILWSAQFGSDRRWVYTTSEDYRVRAWDVITEKEIQQPITREDTIKKLEFSHDRRRMLTVSTDGSARIWDNTGNPISQPMKHDGYLASAEFSSDGKWVLTRYNIGFIRIWEIETGLPVSLPIKVGIGSKSDFFPKDSKILISTDPLYPSTPFTYKIRKIPKIPTNSMKFIEFIELISGHFVNNKNALQRKIDNLTVKDLSHWIITNDLTSEERDYIYWWLNDPIKRNLAPLNEQAIEERIQILIDGNTLHSLNEVLDYFPGHPMALAKLAELTWKYAYPNQLQERRPRVSLWANLALKYAPDDISVREVAEKVLHDIAQPN